MGRRIRQLAFGCVGSVVALTMLVACPVAGVRAQESVTRTLDAALELHAGATCLDRQRLLAHIKMWLGHAPVHGALRIRVIGDAADRQSVSYEIRHNDWMGQREFRPAPSSCDDLHAMLGLTIALVLDTERMQQTWLVLPRAQHMPVLWAAQLSVSQGILLDFAYGLQVGADIALTSLLHLRFDMLGQLARNNMISGSRGSFDLWLPAAAFEVCAGGQPQPSMRLALCSGVIAGVVIGHGRGYAPNYTEAGAWLAWRSGVRFDILLGLRWLIDLDVVSRIYSPAIVADSSHGQAPLRREPATAGLELSIGPALTF